MDQALAGRAVLVTGAARRIGAALARGFHAHGAAVCIHCHQSTGEAEHLRDELNRQRAGSAAIVTADLLDVNAMPTVVTAAVKAFGRLDALINNASTFYPTSFGSVSPAQWDDLMGTNLRAPFFLAQAAAAQLRATKGAIVNMIDIHAQRPLPGHSVYSTANYMEIGRASCRERV